MKLLKSIEDFVTLKQSLGAVYATEAKRLRSFARFVGEVTLQEVTPQQCLEFCYGHRPATSFGIHKHQMLRKFFHHAVGRGYLAQSPAEGPVRRFVSVFLPYIYSRAEVGRLCEGARHLCGKFHYDGPTLRTLLLILYATGLRAGEALALRQCDVDLARRILTIWNAKFRKSRLVPFGSALARSLRDYSNHRQAFPFPLQCRSAFLSTRAGERLTLSSVENVFRRLCSAAAVCRPETDGCRPPRLHDLRATFAVHRLVSWYHDGVDVQQRLPFLATYLGHASLAGTQTYLRMTPELLAEASRRFESYAAFAKEGRR